MHIVDHDPLDRLQEAARGHCNTRTWPRVQAVILAKQRDSAAQIARALGVSRRAVQAWVAAYNRGGLEALPDRPHPGRTPILPRDQESRFLERIDAPPRPEDGVCELRGADIRRILAQEFAACSTLDGVYKLLHRLGDSDLMPRPQHPEANSEVPEDFKEIVNEQIDAIAERHPDKEVQVWHQDEARFGQKGTLTRVWARRGSRPRPDGRESLYVLTAVCAASGASVGLVMPELNTAVVNLFLEEFSRSLAAGVHAVLLWDNAGYHTGGGLVVPPNVSLIGLLPYSPEWNPVENLWHSLRSHHWSQRVYRDYEALRDAAAVAWRAVCLDPEKIRTICAAPYLNATEIEAEFRGGVSKSSDDGERQAVYANHGCLPFTGAKSDGSASPGETKIHSGPAGRTNWVRILGTTDRSRQEVIVAARFRTSSVGWSVALGIDFERTRRSKSARP